MKANILVVEDETEIAELINIYLRNEGMTGFLAEDAETGLSLLAQTDIDLVILDLNLPGMDGFEFLSKLRKTSEVPVVIVSARKADEDLILGLKIGADEYVEKPFSPKVLMARVKAVIRRYRDLQAGSSKSIVFGAFTLDVNKRVLLKNDAVVSLSPKEFDLLLYLLINAGTAKTAAEIYTAVWGKKYGDLSTVAVHIQRLRRKIEADPALPRFIQNVYGTGYVFQEITSEENGP